jgi:phage terminase small subunit
MLPDKHKRFLQVYASNGGNASAAARTVGYRTTSGSDKVTACRILKKPESIEYLHTLLLQALTADAPFAISTIRKLAEEAESEQVKLQACKELLDRAGFKLAERHEFILKDERTSEEIEASIRAHLEELGIVEGQVIQ